MNIKFYKYEGTGNDFIMIDNRNKELSFSKEDIISICNPHLGIGGDGLILVENFDNFDFYMRYYNADGSEAEMCGNGGRCIALFTHHLGIGGVVKHFMAKDGAHMAEIINYTDSGGEVSIKLIDINCVTKLADNKFFLNSGVPHYVELADDIENIDLESAGRKIRYDVKFKDGTNVNFIKVDSKGVSIRTYERGVEAETLACGTGAAAAVIALHYAELIKSQSSDVFAKGGKLKISFDYDGLIYSNITLTAPVRIVFKGEIEF